jgi:hypothetical protein
MQRPWNGRGPVTKPTTVLARHLNSPERKPKSAPAPEPLEDIDEEPDVLDEADALAAMPFDEFYQQLRADIDGVREGSLTSIADAEAAADRKETQRQAVEPAPEEKRSVRARFLTPPASLNRSRQNEDSLAHPDPPNIAHLFHLRGSCVIRR